MRPLPDSHASAAFPCVNRRPVEWPAEWPPTLVTAISTEEEFDWSGPFDPTQRSVAAASRLSKGQDLFDALGVRPTYLVDHPIAADEASARALREIHERGGCEIGAHLHPWVNPPLEEAGSVRNSFPGNLPRELELAKLTSLRRLIETNIGASPRAYQAGRYGFGPNTADALEQLGFEVDLSASPAFDYSAEGGPNYADFSPAPFWFGRARNLLALPVSGAFLGSCAGVGSTLHRLSHSAPLSWFRAPGVLARTRALERVRLSPEGFDLATQQRLTRTLLDSGVRVLVLGLHSPSLLPGCTPYVRTEADLERFLGLMRRYYEFFLGTLGGRHLTATEVHAALSRAHRP